MPSGQVPSSSPPSESDILQAVGWKTLANSNWGPGSSRFAAPYLTYWRAEVRGKSNFNQKELVDISKQLLLDPLKTKSEHRTGTQIPTDMIDVAARLCLLVDIRNPSERAQVIGSTSTPWSESSSLKGLLEGFFKRDGEIKSERKFQRQLTARNLEYLASLRIRWTNNLIDHLRLEEDTVHLFHQVTFLKNAAGSVYPDGLLEETYRSLGCLLPCLDVDSSRWFQKEWKARAHWLDPALGELSVSGARVVGGYRYWRARLEILELTLNQAQPRSLRQWWYDRRNMVQWATFWIAALVLLLTIVQCVAAIVQAWASVKALNK